MKEVNGVKYMEDSDFWMCKHVKAGTDYDGVSVPICELSGLMCEEVLRFSDESCKYERETPNDDYIARWEMYEEPDYYDR